MPKDYEGDFKESRDKALQAGDEVAASLERYSSSGHKDAAKHQFQFAFMVLRNICVAMQSPRGTHYDVYGDIYTRILTPHLQPQANPASWTKYLELVRYFHNLLRDKNLYKESDLVVDHLRALKNKLQNERDYKSVLAVYFQYVLMQLNRPEGGVERTRPVLQAVADTFAEMLTLNASAAANHQYPEIVGEFQQWLMPRRKSATLAFINSLPAPERCHMFDAFFALLAAAKVSPPPRSATQLGDELRPHMEAFMLFMHLDVNAASPPVSTPTQLALQHIRACRDMKRMQQDPAIGYMLPLMYYYVKLAYGRGPTANFAANYAELCGKFTRFMADNADVLVEKRWFSDALITLVLHVAQVHQHAGTVFADFWRAMDSQRCYVAHFELLMGCMKLAPRINCDEMLLAYPCCQSGRKHFVLEVAHVAFVAYGLMVQTQVEIKDPKEDDLVHRGFVGLIKYAISVVASMSCMSPDSKDLKIFYARFSQMTRDLRTKTQARYCLSLAKNLAKVEPKFPRSDWALLLRRLYKTAEALLGDPAAELQLQSFYVAGIVCEGDNRQLHNQVVLYYASPKCLEVGRCLSELWQQGGDHPLRPSLSETQQRTLFQMEMVNFLKYHKYANTPLHASLLRMAATDYSYVLTAQLGELAESTLTKVEAVYQRLDRKLAEGPGLRRLEWLVLGHACAVRLQQHVEMRKRAMMTVNWKDCSEDTLTELMALPEMASVSLSQEWAVVQMARRVVDSFRAFYDKTDEEFIDSDEACIEWEQLLEQLTCTSQHLEAAGYLNYAADGWLLVYRIASTLDDQINSLRALTFLCEHAEYVAEQRYPLDLDDELNRQLDRLEGPLEAMPLFLKRHQTYMLVFLCQVAHYYHRCRGCPNMAEAILQLVAVKHAGLPERVGAYDLVRGTLDAVRFRMFSLQLGAMDPAERCSVNVLDYIDRTMEQFRSFQYISACDSTPYVILLHNLVVEFAEFTAHRLSDSSMSGFLTCVLRVTLQMGLTLRVVQALSTWCFLNLQAEKIERAQAKLQIIDRLIGVRRSQEVAARQAGPLEKIASQAIPEKAVSVAGPPPVYSAMPSVEAMRKMAPESDMSLELWHEPTACRTSARRATPLQAYLSFEDPAIPEPPEWFEWTYFIIGCLTGRLCYLTNDRMQLEHFYGESQKWLARRAGSALLAVKYDKVRLLNMQHYINFLRAEGRLEKALQFLRSVQQDLSRQGNGHTVDSFFQLNFDLLWRVTATAVDKKKATRRVLTFNVAVPVVASILQLPSEIAPMGQLKENTKAKGGQLLQASAQKKSKAAIPFTIYVSPREKATGAAKPTQRKPSPPAEEEVVTLNCSSGDDLNTCQAIDTFDLDTTNDDPPKEVASSGRPKKAQERVASKKVVGSKKTKENAKKPEEITKTDTDSIKEAPECPKKAVTVTTKNTKTDTGSIKEARECPKEAVTTTKKAREGRNKSKEAAAAESLTKSVEVLIQSVESLEIASKPLATPSKAAKTQKSHATTTTKKVKIATRRRKSSDDQVVDLSKSLEDTAAANKKPQEPETKPEELETKPPPRVDDVVGALAEQLDNMHVAKAKRTTRRAQLKPPTNADIGASVVCPEVPKTAPKVRRAKKAADETPARGTKQLTEPSTTTRGRGKPRLVENDENRDPAAFEEKPANSRRRLRLL